MRKLAAIDLGTNMFTLLIVEEQENYYETIYRDAPFVQIGEKGIDKGFIAPAAFERAFKTLQNFRNILDEHDCKDVYAVATSAIRSAKNGAEFVEKVRKELGINIEVIDGDKEAELIAYGVQANYEIPEKSLIMDIGGGSVEFIIADSKQIFWKQSFEIGSQRLAYEFHEQEFMFEGIAKLEQALDQILLPLMQAISEHLPKKMIGTKGSFSIISRIYCYENGIEYYFDDPSLKLLDLPISHFKHVLNLLIHKTVEERENLKGMKEHHAKMLSASACLVDYVLKKGNFHEIKVVNGGLKEGILYQQIRKAKK